MEVGDGQILGQALLRELRQADTGGRAIRAVPRQEGDGLHEVRQDGGDSQRESEEAMSEEAMSEGPHFGLDPVEHSEPIPTESNVQVGCSDCVAKDREIAELEEWAEEERTDKESEVSRRIDAERKLTAAEKREAELREAFEPLISEIDAVMTGHISRNWADLYGPLHELMVAAIKALALPAAAEEG